MEFSPTMMQHAPGGMLQSPYCNRQSGTSPARSSAGYDSFLRSPASGRAATQHRPYLRHGEGDPAAERGVSIPQVKASPTRAFPTFISCMFATSVATSPSSPAPSSPLMSSPRSTSSSPCYNHHNNNHHHQLQHHNQLHQNLLHKRQMMWKENNPTAAVLPRSPAPPGLLQPVSALSDNRASLTLSPNRASLSPNRASLSHCKRRLDFNHNPVSDTDLDLNLNVHFSAATHALEELTIPFCGDLSPGLAGEVVAGSGGRGPAVAVARRNERERNRVKLINMTFATLREHLPHSGGGHKGGGGGGGGGGGCGKSKKMSKVETLRAAIDYIRQLHGLIKDKQQQQTSSDPSDKDREDAFPQGKMDKFDTLTVSLQNPLTAVLKVEPMDVDGDLLVASTTSLPLLSSSSLALVSPPSSGEGGGSPRSDDGCFGYDLLGAEDEDLLEFASNWF